MFTSSKCNCWNPKIYHVHYNTLELFYKDDILWFATGNVLFGVAYTFKYTHGQRWVFVDLGFLSFMVHNALL